MTCTEVMTKDPIHCIPSDTVARVAKVMKIENVGVLPVCESRSNRKVVGIITDRDLVLHVLADGRDPNKAPVDDVMTRTVYTCQADDDFERVLEVMSQKQVRRVPIVDKAGDLVGIIGQAEIVARVKEPKIVAEAIRAIWKPSAARAA